MTISEGTDVVEQSTDIHSKYTTVESIQGLKRDLED